jgi:DNA-binding transcriptional LysR family regulator
MTQPALTRAIKTLEDQIGKELFIRTPRGLNPTDAANAILKRYTKIASGLAGILSEIDQIKSLNGSKLTLAKGVFAGHTSVFDAVGQMSKKYKQMEFHIIQRDWQLITKDILAGEIDLGIMELGVAEHDPVFAVELLSTTPVYFLPVPTIL